MDLCEKLGNDQKGDERDRRGNNKHHGEDGDAARQTGALDPLHDWFERGEENGADEQEEHDIEEGGPDDIGRRHDERNRFERPEPEMDRHHAVFSLSRDNIVSYGSADRVLSQLDDL